jgi:hypothetical protein
LVMIKEAVQEVAGWKAKSALKGRKHHNFLGIGCWDVLTYSRSPLEHIRIWDKMVFNQLTNLILSCNRSLEKVWV